MSLEFKPALKHGDVVYLKGIDKYFKVVGVEPIPLIEKDFGAINSGQELKDQEVADLYLKDGRLGQYRIYIATDGIEVKISQPKATKRYATRSAIGKITRFHAQAFDFFGPLVEVWIFEDENKIFFDVKNTLTTNLTESKVYFIGYQYALEETGPDPNAITIELEALG